MRAVLHTFLHAPVRTHVLFVFLVALVVRALYAVFHLQTNGLILENDALDFIQFADFIRQQGWMVLDITDLRSHSGPGYPWLVAINQMLLGEGQYGFLIAIQVAASAGSAVLVYLLAHKLFDRKSVALFAGIWAACYLHFVRYVPLIGKESVMFLLFLAVIYLAIVIRKDTNQRFGQVLGWALLFNGLIHIDERFFVYLPLFVCYMALPTTGALQWKKSALAILGVIVFMMPLLYRNYLVYGGPVILTERTAKFTDKLLGSNIATVDYGTADKISSYDRAYLPLYEHKVDSLLQGMDVEKAGIKYIDDIKEGIAKGHVPHTYSKGEDYWYDFLELWRPVRFEGGYIGNGYRYMPRWRAASNIVYGLQYGLLLPFMCIGIVVGLRQRQARLDVGLLVALLVSHTFLHVFVEHGIQRYRIPLDPLIIILGIFGVCYLYEKILAKR